MSEICMVCGSVPCHCSRPCPSCASLRRELKEAKDKAQRFDSYFINDPGDVCKKCGGVGRRGYASTATWRGGVGGQMLTEDVCNECWGSGKKSAKGADLRRLYAALAAANDALSRERRDNDAYREQVTALAERAEKAERERDAAQGELCRVLKVLATYVPIGEWKAVAETIDSAPCPHAERVKVLEEEYRQTLALRDSEISRLYDELNDPRRRSSGGT